MHLRLVIAEQGWFKSSYHDADSVVMNMSAGANPLTSGLEITPTSSGTESGIDYVEFKLTSFSTIGFFAKTNLFALPIELTDFNANLKKNVVELKWQTASEINNDYFVVQRSIHTKTWEDVITIEGSGNSSKELSYFAVDFHPSDGTSYYRLKQVDFDGQYSYSNIDAVEYDNGLNAELVLFPNPSSNQITVQIDGESMGNVKIKNYLGQQIYPIIISNQMGQIVLDIHNLPKGIFYAEFDGSTTPFLKLD